MGGVRFDSGGECEIRFRLADGGPIPDGLPVIVELGEDGDMGIGEFDVVVGVAGGISEIGVSIFVSVKS